jgi:hypothetical protein
LRGGKKTADPVREHRAGLTINSLQGVTSMAEQDFTDSSRELERSDYACAMRGRLAPAVAEAQLRLVDGTPLTGWITSPEAFDREVAQVLQRYPREQVRIQIEEAL